MLRFSSVNTAPAATDPAATYGDLKHGLRITLPNRPPIEDVAAPKRHFLANPRPFVRCLTRKLFTYESNAPPTTPKQKPSTPSPINTSPSKKVSRTSFATSSSMSLSAHRNPPFLLIANPSRELN